MNRFANERLRTRLRFRLFGVFAVLLSLTGTAIAQVSEEQRIVEAISPEIREEFGVRIATWKPAAANFPAHAYIVGTLAPDAIYDEIGNLIAVGATVPVSYELRVPIARCGRLILHIPPGALEHNQAPLGPMIALAREGYALATVNRLPYTDPRLAAIGNPVPTREELTDSYSEGFNRVKRLYSKLFGASRHTYAFAFSRGVLVGFGLMRNIKTLCEGQLLVVGSAGQPTRIAETLRVIRAGGPYRVPRTGLLLTFEELYDRLLSAIGLVDPEYSAEIQRGAASVLDYDLASRAESVMDWDFSGNLRVPTIVVQGLADTQSWPTDVVLFDRRIDAAGETDRKRLYFVPRMIHGPWPVAPMRDAFHMLERWAENSETPGTLSFPNVSAVVPNSHQLGLERDPDTYLDYMLTQ
jgi:hypothetical protein